MDLLEDAGKVVGVFVADGAAGCFDGQVGVLQQPGGVVHAQAGEELGRGLRGVLAEESREVFRSDPARAGYGARTADTGVMGR